MKKQHLLIALAILVAAFSGSSTIAQSADPSSPQALGNRVPVSSTLVGSRAGAFHYYGINYPGDGSVVTIKMTFVPADPVTRQAVGFNVYGKDAFLIGPPETDFDGQRGIVTLEYADNTPATWLIQVFNYGQDMAMQYTLEVTGLTGLPATPTPGPRVANSLADIIASDARFDTLSQALEISGLAVILQGQGSFTVLAPTDDAFDKLPAGTLDGLLADPERLRLTLMYHIVPQALSASQIAGRDTLDTLARQPLRILSSEGITWVNEARLSGKALEASNGILQPVDAVLIPPQALVPSQARLTGASGGEFHKYPFFYPASGEVTITLVVHNFDPSFLGAIGFDIYGPQGRVGESRQADSSNHLSATISSDVAGYYVVQVYNYAPAYTMYYSLTWE